MKKACRILLVAVVACLLCAFGVLALACSDADVTLASIEITKNPTKMTYVAGEKFDAAGMAVTAYYSDGNSRVLASDEYTVRAPSLTVANGKFKETKSVKITYTENEVARTVSLSVTVTNAVTAVEILNNPDKTEYFPGEKFDPAGLKIKATFKNGAQSDVEINSSNAKFSANAITAGMNTVTVTYGEYAFDVEITVKSGFYIEAETGLLNGATISGDNYRSLPISEVEENVVKLYSAHLIVEHGKALSDIKRAELIAAGSADVEGALNEYLGSDEYRSAIDNYTSTSDYNNAINAYKSGDNEDIDGWDYKADVAHYRAHGDAYLGELNKNDEVSFVFDASAAYSGSVVFRLSSTYLIKDNDGGWIPVEMGGVQFKELCEFYVNGKKAEIGDDVTLEGGKTEDGSANSALWTNWKEVEFSGIDFLAGRNVIILKIRDHKLTSPAQPSNKAVPNVDGVILNTDADVTITPYNNSSSFSYSVSSVGLDAEDGVKVKVEGSMSVNGGYIADLFNVKLGATLADITVEDGKFVATVDAMEFATSADGHAITVCGKTLPADNIEVDTEPVTAYRIYRLDTKNFIKLSISEAGEYSVELTGAEIAPVVTIEERDGKPYIVIGGGAYTATVQGFDAENPVDVAEIRRQVAAAIKQLYTFNLENNPLDGGAGGWGERMLENAHVVNVLDDDKFEIVCELSTLTVGRHYGVHFNKTDAAGGDDKFNFSSANFPGFTSLALTTVTVGSTKYVAFYNDIESGYTFSWDCLAVFVSDATAKSYTTAKLVGFEEIDGKPYAVFSGACSNYTADELNTMITLVDFENSTDSNHKINGNNYIVTVEDGKYYIKCDISVLIVIADKDGKNGGFYMHIKPFGSGENGDISHADGVQSLTVGEYTYSAEECTITWDGGSWTGHIIKVKAVDDVKAQYTVTLDYRTADIANASVKVWGGEKLEKPVTPSTSVHKIIDWYSDEACTTKFDFNTAINADITIYASYDSTYVFEAEYTDLTGLKGKGFSHEAHGADLAVPDAVDNESVITIGREGLAKASNGFYVSYFYVKGLTLTFKITSDVEVNDAKLSMRLSGELIHTLTLTDEEWVVKVNGEKIEYGSFTVDNIDTNPINDGKREFQDFVVTTSMHLNAGENVITLTVNNDKPMGGVIASTAPLIDCIKIDTTAKLSWNPQTSNLSRYEDDDD